MPDPAIFYVSVQSRDDRDFSNKGGKIRRAVITTQSVMAARAMPDYPKRNSQHPEDPTYLLDSDSAAVGASGWVEAEFRYSNNREYAFDRAPNRDDPNYYHWGYQDIDVTLQVPIAVRVERTFANSPTAVKVWTLQKLPTEFTRIVRPLTVRVTVANPRVFDAIKVQKNRIHRLPDGLKYRFRGGTQSPKDETTYDMKYVWELDDGNSSLDFPTLIGDPDFQYCEMVDGSAFSRRPYHRWVTAQTGDPRTQIPKVMEVRAYQEDLLGWRTLPGSERIQ